MVVTACNIPYVPQTMVMLRSLSRWGEIKHSQMCVMAFGNKEDCRLIRKTLKNHFSGIEVIPVLFADKEFAFLEEFISTGRWATFSDYLRAWFAKYAAKYIWMDADIIVKKPLRQLLNFSSKTEVPLMTQIPLSIYNNDGFCQNMFEAYVAMYKKHYMTPSSRQFDSKKEPILLNNGVLVVDRNYSKEWKEIYLNLNEFRQSKKISKLLAPNTTVFGQGIWNLLFWRHNGVLLDEKYNHFVLGWTNYQLSTINHFISQHSIFWREAIRLRLI